MSQPYFRRGKEYVRRTRYYLLMIRHPERDSQLDSYQLALIREMRSKLTSREMECMCLYYLREINMEHIARELELNPSTVSRTIARASQKLDDILRLAREISPLRPAQSA